MSAEDKQHAKDWERVALSTENDRFKARYPVYIRYATLASFGVWLAVFLFFPEIQITPYTLPEESVEVIDIPDAIDIPPPPEELPRPQVPIEAAPDAEVDEDVELADTLPDDFDYIPPPSGGGAGNDFVVYDTKPELTRYVPPEYSEFAREASLEGVVYVDILVGVDGRPQQVRLQRPAHPVLNKAALAAAMKAGFTPGKQRDIPVQVWVTIPYKFSLH